MKTNPLLLLFAWIPVVMAQPVLEVRVHNRAGVPETALARTAQVVADILGKAGIGLRWKVAPPNSPEASRMVLGNGRGAIQRPERRCAARRDIALLISTDSPALAALRLGQAEPLSPSGINATVYYSRVISAANRYGVTVEAVLGHAITHEIGHVMLRTWDHRKGFLMSGAWEGPHFRAIRSSGMSFEAQDAQSIRETLEGKDCPGTDMEGPETVAALRAGKEFEAKPGVERMAGPENVPVQPRLRQDGMDALLSGVRPCRVPAPEAVTAGYVESCRPSAIDEKERAAVRRSLPREGEITNLTQEQRRKLALLKQIFRAHKREDVYEVKIIAAPQAWIGLHARAVLLISAPTLEVLSAEELAGMSAHEIGHEFQWSEREAAYARGDAGLLRELELVSDAIGAITLKQMGLAEEVLVSALEKVYRYNRVRFGAASNEEAYPSLQERRKVILRAASRAAVRTE